MKPISTNFLIFFILFAGFAPQLKSQDKGNESSKTILKILSFNILHGATTEGSFDLDTIAAVIQRTDPDLVALQEVDFKTKRARKFDLATELGWRTGMQAIFGRAMYFDGGEYGEAVLSKYSFLNTRNVALPFSPGNEPRAALEVTVVLPTGDTVSFVGTHLDHLKDNTDRLMQVKKINKVFSENKYPTILAGDLNDVPGSKPIQILESVFTASYQKNSPQATYSSEKPVKKIDYVMFRPSESFKVIKTEAICDEIASDHCAWLVWLELN